jgi:hypothetical protein
MHARSGILSAALLLVLSGCGGGGGDDGDDNEADGVRPVAGGFGGGLEGGATFLVTLVVLEANSDTIDHVKLTCAPEGTLDLLNSITVGTDVAIDGGSFTAESADVAIDGEFTSPERAEGEIRALTSAAQACGVPESGTWAADCELQVKESDGGFEARSGGCGLIE